MKAKKLLHAEQDFDEIGINTIYWFTLTYIGSIKDSTISPYILTRLLTHIAHFKMSTYKKLNFDESSDIEFTEDEVRQMLSTRVTQTIVPVVDDVSDVDDFNLDFDERMVSLGEPPKLLSSRELLERSRIVALNDTLVMNDVGKPILNAPKLVRNNAIKRQLTEIANYNEDMVEPLASKGKKSQGPKVMRWCVTWNNPEVDGFILSERLKGDQKIKGYAFQLERGESGTPHFQMYVEFKKQEYCTAVRASLGNEGVSTFRCNGTKAQNVKYCTKDDDRLDGPWVNGTCASDEAGQGKRSDLEDFAKEVLLAGGVNDEVREKYAGHAVRYSKQAQYMVQQAQFEKAKEQDRAYWKEQLALKKAGQPYGQKPRKLIFYFGPSAAGKTTEAKIRCEEEFDEAPYMKQGTTKWWCGYNLEKCVIVDEWQKDMTGTLESFNDLTNYGMYRGETKGGQTPIIAECMMFTSNRHPIDIFKTKWTDARFRALARRFEEVNWIDDKFDLIVLKNPGKEPMFVGDEPSEEWNQWNMDNAAWVHFWKGRGVREGDSVIYHTDGSAPTCDVESYFTW